MNDKTKQFITKAIQVHKDGYEYEEVDYISCRIKLKIFCKKCQKSFWQTSKAHLRGQGCPKCGKEKFTKSLSSNTNEFIKKATSINNNYNYSKTNYINNKIKVEIICHIHGSFWQTPANHLAGNGCPKCKFDRQSKNLSSNTDEFIKKATLANNNKYGYLKTIYKSSQHKVEIICPIHGSFWQKANSHLAGHGCPFCIESKMECKFSKFLQDNNIKFEREKTFNNLIGINGGLLRFDFFLPLQNIFVECDGEQHHRYVKGMMKEGELEKIQEHDRRKNEWCSNNGYKLVRLVKTNFNDLTYKNIINEAINE